MKALQKCYGMPIIAFYFIVWHNLLKRIACSGALKLHSTSHQHLEFYFNSFKIILDRRLELLIFLANYYSSISLSHLPCTHILTINYKLLLITWLVP